VVTNEHSVRTAAVLGGVGGREVPFDVAGPNAEGDVIEVDDLT